MKILHIVPWVPLFPNTGGLETYLSCLCVKQVEEGNIVYVVGRTKKPISRPTWCIVKGVTYYIIPAGNFPKFFPLNLSNPMVLFNLLLNTLKTIPVTIRAIRFVKPDIVNFYEVYQAPVSLLCRLLGYPTVLGHFAFQPHWRLIPRDKRLSLTYFIWYPILRCFSAIHTHVRCILSLKGNIPNLHLLERIVRDRVNYMQGCVDPSVFAMVTPDPEIEKLSKEGYVIVLCPRRLVPEKGVYYLLRAVPKILKNSAKKTMFVFTGEGPLLPVLKAEAFRLGIEDNILFLGNIPYESVLRCMRASDIVVIPSTGEETLGIAILEAYALKKAVVGTRFGGIPDVIEDTRSGLLVEPANSEELADAIIKLANSPWLREELSKRGYELVMGRFNIHYTVAKLLRVYISLSKIKEEAS